MYVSQLPIPPASPEAQAQLSELAARAAGAEGTELAEVEAEINRIVFGLFGLSAEEVALVTVLFSLPFNLARRELPERAARRFGIQAEAAPVR